MKLVLQRARTLLRVPFIALAAAGLASCAAVRLSGPTAEQRTLISNVTVIPMAKQGSLAGRDVLVAGGRIVSVGRRGSVRPLPTDRIIDGSGKYLMPGLWDMHVHALTGRSDPARETLPLYLSHGIVGVRDLGSTLEELAAARTALAAAGDLPELVAAGPLLDGPKQPWQQKMALPLGTVDEARAAAERLAASGVDFLKIYNNLSPQQFAAAAAVAKARGLPIAGHVPFKMTLEQVSAAGQKSIEHGGLQLVTDCIPDGQKAAPAMLGAWIKEGYPGRYRETSRWWTKRDQAACRALYQRMAKRGTWVTPTLVNDIKGGRWTREEDLVGIPDRLRKACEESLTSINSSPALRDAADRDLFDLVGELHRQGVPLLAGSDVPNECLWHGSSLHKELAMMVHSGLSNWEALKTATLNPALYLGRANEGVVREGAAANLLLLDADPLADIANTTRIAGVMLKGRWHDADELARMRAPKSEAATAAKSGLIYENAMVWTGKGFERRSLAFRGDRFVDPRELAADAVRIDASARFIVPAYANAHAHVTPANPAGSWSYVKDGVFYVWNPNTVVIGQADLDFYKRSDAYDVATAQGGITDPGGHPEDLYVNLLTKWVPAYKGMTQKDFLGNAFHYGRDKAEIDAALDLLVKQKADFVKAYLLNSERYRMHRDDPKFKDKGLNPLNFPYLVAAARARGLPVTTHVETVSDLKTAALAGAFSAAHMPGYWDLQTEEEFKARTLTSADASAVAKSGIKLVPTYALAAGSFAALAKSGKPDPQREKRVYALQASNLRLLKEAGAVFLAGTDTGGPIFQETEHLVRIGGLSTMQALQMVLHTGNLLFPQRRIGCFEAGCEADFLVLSADPSRDIANLRKIETRIMAGAELRAPEPAPK